MCRSETHVDFVDEVFVDSYEENLEKFKTLSTLEYECRLGVFACASRDGIVVMQRRHIVKENM
jgi:hypothetical protein